MPLASDLKQAIATYEALISNYTVRREHLIDRRHGAADHLMVELDDRLEANARTIDALRGTLEVTREHLRLVEKGRAEAAAESMEKRPNSPAG